MNTPSVSPTDLRAQSAIAGAFRSCLPHFVAAAVFSGAMNLLYLATPLYLLQVYNRVLPSRSGPTLVALSVALLLSLLAMAALDSIRARVLIRAGNRFDQALSAPILSVLMHRRGRGVGVRHSEALRDLDQVRLALTGIGMQTLFDAPWTPVFLALLFIVHPILGLVALIAAVVLLCLALLSDFASRRPLAAANEAGARSYAFADEMLRNAEPVLAMGMHEGLGGRWFGDRSAMLDRNALAGERNAAFAAGIRFLRLTLQSAMLGAGAWLAIDHKIPPSSMFVAMVLMGRAVAPVEQIVGAGRQIGSARAAWRRIALLLSEAEPGQRRTRLPGGDGTVALDNLVYVPEGGERPIIRGLSLRLSAGEALGIVGPSAAGKSTLVRLMTGALAPSAGRVRLNGADIRLWDRGQLGRGIGYLPQDVGLFGGTVRENIARFDEAPDEAIVLAAMRSDVHDMILDLPHGYDTRIGDGGVPLSGGQRQRLGLARALLGDPRLLVLDEPNANLDGEGEQALKQALTELKATGTTIVVVAHRPGIVEICDTLLVLQDGAISMLGPRVDVMREVRRQAVRPVPVPSPGGAVSADASRASSETAGPSMADARHA